MKKIDELKAKIRANKYIMEKNPGKFEDLQFDNDQMQKEIDELENPKTFIVKGTETRAGKTSLGDLGWNCLAIQKNGEQCKCKRVYGRYCKRHASHYIEELGAQDEGN